MPEQNYDNGYKESKLLDLSAHGARIGSCAEIKVSSNIKIRLSINGRVYETRGQVRWVASTSDSRVRLLELNINGQIVMRDFGGSLAEKFGRRAAGFKYIAGIAFEDEIPSD